MAKKSSTQPVGNDVVVVETPPVIPESSPPTTFVPRHGRLIPRHDATLAECPTSLDLSTPRGKALMIAAGNPSDLQFDPAGNLLILAVDWCVFPDSGSDPDTGLVSEFCRVVFFDAAGQTYRTTSAHAPHRLAAICDLYGKEDWGKGIPIIIRERKSRKTGRTYHDLRVLVPDPTPETPEQE